MAKFQVEARRTLVRLLSLPLDGNRRTMLRVAVPVAVGFAVLYWITNPGNRSETADGFWYADRVETLPLRALPLSRHLLYLPLMRLIFNGARLVAPTVRAYEVMVGASLALGLMTIALMIALMRRHFGVSLRSAVISAVGLGLSFEFWRYSVEAEVYTLGTLTALGAFWFAPLKDIEPRRLAISCLFGGLAVVSNSLNVTLVLIAIPLYLFVSRRFRTSLRWLLWQGTTCAITFAAVLGFVGGELGGEGGVPPAAFSLKLVLAAPVTFASSLISTNALNGFPAYLQLVAETVPGAILDDERFLASFIPSELAWFSMVAWFGLAALGVASALVARRARKSLEYSVPRGPVSIAGFWLAFYACAVLIFGPGQEVWILALVPFWLLLGVLVIDPLLRLRRRIAVGGLMLLLGLHNLISGFLVMAKPETDFNNVKSQWLVENASQSDVVVTAQGAAFARYIRYYSAGDVLYVEEDLDIEEIPGQIRELRKRSGRVFFTEDVFIDPAIFRDRGRNVSAEFGEFVEPLREQTRIVSRSEAGLVFELQMP